MTARIRLFAQAREAAGCASDDIDAPTLGAVLHVATERYGDAFARVLEKSTVWINGDEPPDGNDTAVAAADEVAVLPPVSGGW